MSQELVNYIEVLEKRADFLKSTRDFFLKNDILEVDTPILSKSGLPNAHIDLMKTKCSDSILGYLQSSPELGLKKVLAKYKKNIYQLSHVFRKSEIGPRHRPEFTMLEWYLVGQPIESLIEMTIEYFKLFLDFEKTSSLTYKEAFLRSLDLDPFKDSKETIFKKAKEFGYTTTSIESAIEFLWSEVEKSFCDNTLYVIRDFPETSAELAKTKRISENLVADRFEIYYKGYELANGYNELLCPEENIKRLEAANSIRTQLGKELIPIDETFINSLRQKLPECVGVAVGFDRLMMLTHGAQTIDEILPLSWEET